MRIKLDDGTEALSILSGIYNCLTYAKISLFLGLSF